MERRDFAIGVGISLLFVPTLFSLFPGLAGWHPRWRILLLAVWVVLGLVAVWTTDTHQRDVSALVQGARARRDLAREAAGKRAIALVIDSRPAVLRRYEIRVFVYNADSDRLLPVFEPADGPSEPEGWARGQGATGYAFETNARVLALGPVVSDGSYGLTPAQRQRYRDVRLVAAQPMTNALEQPIGVVSLSSRRAWGDVRSTEVTDAHVELTEILARIVIDLLGWASD